MIWLYPIALKLITMSHGFKATINTANTHK